MRIEEKIRMRKTEKPVSCMLFNMQRKKVTTNRYG